MSRPLLAAAALVLVGAGDASAAPKGSPWGASYFPDVPLTTQDGKTVRLTSLSAVDDPGFLASNIDNWMPVDPRSHAPVKSYADAPRRARPSAGEDLFRQKCAACHTIGRGDLLGPDLADVTRRRDRAWLARWLADPEKLVAEKDPLALELAGRSRPLAMPNLGLTHSEVDALMAFMGAAPTVAAATADR